MHARAKPFPVGVLFPPLVSWLFFKARGTSISDSIREERATWKNSQLTAAQRVAMKMGRRLSRGCGIGYVSI